ncbi:MAG: hypothetical protein H6744_15500 [Deltaproteobacteria bacterium]|nr:hypothetical protein [Deltaproteobacteria bacterium]MCB9788087.1 hypothetical protein [Deltaproteobacteria bacterium]
MTTTHFPPRRALLSAILALAAAGAWPGHARADITGFSLRSIEEVGSDFTLATRFGKTADAADHFINIEDCQAYQGHKATFNVTVSNLGSDFAYGVAFAKPGKTCPNDHANFEGYDTEQCTVLVEDESLVTNFSFEVDLTKLTGGDCTAGTNSEAHVYVVAEPSGTSSTVQTQRIDFIVDLERPAAPVLDEVEAADRRLVVRWTDSANDEDGLTYNVYYSTTAIADDPGADVVTKKDITAKTYSIEDDTLQNDVSYHVRVASLDDADNRSVLSGELVQAPKSATDFWERYQQVGGTEQGGYCFVATAAYGSPMSGQLDLLRAFRDQVLLRSVPGRAFVRQYYRWGRFAAFWIADRPVARAAVRVALVPLVWVAFLTTRFGVLGGFALMLMAAAGLVWTRRRILERTLTALPLEARR